MVKRTKKRKREKDLSSRKAHLAAFLFRKVNERERERERETVIEIDCYRERETVRERDCKGDCKGEG